MITPKKVERSKEPTKSIMFCQSAVATSYLADELLKSKNNKDLKNLKSQNDYRKNCGSLLKIATDVVPVERCIIFCANI